MKLTKAIEIGDLNVREAGKKMPADTLTALKILIEAAKEVKKARYGDPALDGELLPGEDE